MATRITIRDQYGYELTITSESAPSNPLGYSPNATEYTVTDYKITYQGITYNCDNLNNKPKQFHLPNATTNISGFTNSIVDVVITANPKVNDDDHPFVLISIRNAIKKGEPDNT